MLRSVFLLLCCLSLSLAVPDHGHNKVVLFNNTQTRSGCTSLTMAGGSRIRVSLYNANMSAHEAVITFKITLYESQCEAIDKKNCAIRTVDEIVMTNTQVFKVTSGRDYINFHSQKKPSSAANSTNTKNGTATTASKRSAASTEVTAAPTDGATTKAPTDGATTKAPNDGTTTKAPNDDTTTKAPNDDTTTAAPTNGTTTTAPTTPPPTEAPTTTVLINNASSVPDDPEWATFTTNNSGVFDVVIEATAMKNDINFSLAFHVDMKNKYGYLSLVDYPAMIVYSILMILYIFYAILWLVLMALEYKDLVRLQFWILAVILLGFLEKVFFVAEYGTANGGIDSSGLIYVAEIVSAAKRALSRVLIIIVCEGFGTVKPRLGHLLTKVVFLGFVYFIVAFIDGVLRASKGIGNHGLTTMLTFGLLFLLDTGIVYWIFSALINTRRNLRVRKNTVKLALYNHLGYALIATVIASLTFIIWQFIYITRSNCTNDWREMWLIECFWHMLFCFMLLIVMIIWRPSANKLRFAYSPVSNGDSDEEEQGANKNFETVKMRPVSGKSESTKQQLTSMEAEEDLKWVEQNLPTTAIDKAAQMVLDSEEEVMTTRFEASKLN
ncbi:PREDICTED: transmembrane protein 87A-like [Amphimedon queenslandica]|uniref:GOST seven transmembrane domain-containing protein n=5 Tax=Amphimedon queenslandica TaxID=400682 RepID=A0AAN0ID37_AMPQE|nr:PREDICTED: transmembrane protein 87A-like [Amphimedon queenslandica]|eukprot:XP_003385804.1 PREDICTED: transmembrane protein 87A-like [Amphimedon queenslandica]